MNEEITNVATGGRFQFSLRTLMLITAVSICLFGLLRYAPYYALVAVGIFAASRTIVLVARAWRRPASIYAKLGTHCYAAIAWFNLYALSAPPIIVGVFSRDLDSPVGQVVDTFYQPLRIALIIPVLGHLVELYFDIWRYWN